MTRWTVSDLAKVTRTRQNRLKAPSPATPVATKRQKASQPPPAKPARGKQGTEDVLFEQIELLGLPLPARQHHFAAPQRKFRADFCWLARRLIVEVEGQVHSIRARREADIERRQWCHFNGWTVIAVSAKQVRSGEAIRVVERLLTP